MAGAGKRTFIAGEVLTAAQVNDFLMDQSVMRFSGSAARAASITVPTEGMVTYLDDTNTIEFYDGSSWIKMQDDTIFTAKGDLLVGATSGSPVVIPIGVDGQVLTAASAQPGGMAWVSPAGAGQAAYFTVAGTGVTAMGVTLTPGFYRIQTSTTTTWTSAQFRFVDSSGNLFGAALTGGAGFFTIPVNVASVNLTTASAAPFTVLVEELPTLTEQLLDPPTNASVSWTELSAWTPIVTTASTAASVGGFNLTTGEFVNYGPTASLRSASVGVSPTASLGDQYTTFFVQSNPAGIWSAAASATAPRYPFVRYNANATFVPPPWATSVDVLVVSGGGGGNRNISTGPGPTFYYGGGGGAGGASVFTGVPVSGSVAITVGGGGAAAADGSSSSYGPTRSTTGGGKGGARDGTASTAGSPGGSGGGGPLQFTPPSTVITEPGGSGTPGQGFGGATGTRTPGDVRSAGGGGGAGGAGTVISGTTSGGGIGITQWGIRVAGGGGGGANNPADSGGGMPFGGASGGLSPGGSAVTNTGGGGGGTNSTSTGNAGAPGTVIVKVNS